MVNSSLLKREQITDAYEQDSSVTIAKNVEKEAVVVKQRANG
jgi:hypothetical protein